MNRPFAVLSIGMAVLYVILAVAAAGCPAVDAPASGSHPGHHHHASHVAHSAFCAWACQANPTVGVIVDVPHPVSLQFFVGVAFITTALLTRLSARVPDSRGPPSASSI